MPFNLELNGYRDTSNTERITHNNTHLSWRQPRDESFSDWTIIIKDAEIIKHYHVHRCQIGGGPRKSEYFAKVFRSEGLAEAKTKTSEIALMPSAAKAFPIMLDYIYSGNLEATTELAFALRYLSDYFDISGLFSKVDAFIQNDLSKQTMFVYWEEAKLYNDGVFLTSMIHLIAENFACMKTDFLSKMSPAQFCDVVSCPRLFCSSELLSVQVAEYLKCHKDQITSSLVRSLTSPKKMPHISPEYSVFFVKLNAEYLQDNQEDEKPTLFYRCVGAFLKSDISIFPAKVRSEIKKTESEEPNYWSANDIIRKVEVYSAYEKLSKDDRLILLEAAVICAKQEIEELNIQNRKLKADKTMIEEMAQFEGRKYMFKRKKKW